MIIKLIVIQLITFVGIVALLRFLYSKNIQIAMGRLTALHEENLAKESELESELQAAKEERAAQVQKGVQEAQRMIDEAKKELLMMKLQAEEQTRDQATKLVLQAKAEAEGVKAAAHNAMERESLQHALDIIRQVFTERNARDIHGYFIEEILEEIALLSPDKFLPSQTVTVIASRALTEDQRQRLKSALESKMGQPLAIQETVDEAVVSGLSLEMGGMVIDGTLRNRLNKIISHATERL